MKQDHDFENNTPRPSPHSDAEVAGDHVLFPGQRIHAGFLVQAQRQATAQALVWSPSPGVAQGLTYGALRDWSARIAAFVRAQAAPTGELPAVVAIILPKGWAQAAAALGVCWSGSAYVPLDVTWPASRVAAVLEQTRCRVVIGTRAERERFPVGLEPCWLCLDEWLATGEQPEQAVLRWRSAGDFEPSEADALALTASQPDALAYVIYTSGSTGQPKGVMIEHRAACVTLAEVVRRWRVDANDRVLALSSLSFDLSVFDLFGVLAAGATVVLPVESQRRDPAAWVRLAGEQAVTLWNSVPALLQMAVDYVERRAELARTWPGPLRLVMLSGDWIPLPLPGRLRALASGAAVVSLGGATEASIWSIAYELDAADAATMATWRSVPYGKALAGQSVRVLRGGDDGARDLTPCPAWVTGRIFIGGGGLARGYWGNPEESDRRFFVDARSGERLYDTGDLGRLLPDGTIELLGRVDQQVKIQGYRVELGEIESALTKHPGVAAAAVRVFDGHASGSKQLVGYVVPRNLEEELDLAAVRKFMAETLPPYMLPVLQVLSELPLNANDKVDASALPAPVSRPTSAPATESLPQLEALQRVAQDVLNTPAIGPEDNLLELGANSADILAIITRVEGELNIEVDIEAFFTNPTLRGILERNPTATT